MLLNQVLRRAVRYSPDKPATVFEGRHQTWREVGRRVRALAEALRAAGIGPGERVAIYELNSPQFLETVFACFEIGVVIVPLNTRLAADELVFIINDAECTALITDEILQANVAGFRARLEGIRHFIAAGAADGFTDYETLIAQHLNGTDTPVKPAELSSEDGLVGLFYTSGTTGLPKGVMLSHRNLWMNAMHSLVMRSAEPNPVYLHTAPMFHLADFPAIINVTLLGGAHAMIRKFDVKAVMELIERERVTSTMFVPTMLNFIINHPDFDRHDLGSLKRIGYGASPMPVELLRRAMQLFPGCEFNQGYGQTESSPLLTTLLFEDHVTDGPEDRVRRLASCGRPVIGVEVEVVNEQGELVRPGEVGEVVARGPNVMLGYWKRPEETESTLRGGWLHTGDMAMVDEEGYIFLVDRKKDMIISGGENVYSSEVENVIYTHPAIHEAAVIGVPDDKWGEAVRAIVTLRAGANLTERELIDYCAARLADYKVPKSVEIRASELPKSGTGKILKKELREPYWAGQTRRVH
ncbi:MAG: long-chain-fatty-acid--CoA ligase [Blastocatellia bacterium]